MPVKGKKKRATVRSPRRKAGAGAKRPGLNLQDVILRLSEFWVKHGCVLTPAYDVEVGAGTMCPETFLRALGPNPYRVAYVQPSRRPADGRYGENPNRLLKHLQYQVILKPPPRDVQDSYLKSLEVLGINLQDHDIRFEEDNWESPTLGAWGVGWQVMLDGLEITQFTYFQQCGGIDLEPISAELTYGLERICAFLQDVSSVYDIRWSDGVSYGDLRRDEELQFSVYDFEMADVPVLFKLFELHEAEATRLLKGFEQLKTEEDRVRYPVRKAFDLCLKCSHLFNILDARGAISVTERVSLIGRVRRLSCGVAPKFMEQNNWLEQA